MTVITERATVEGKIYLYAIKDVYSIRIVGTLSATAAASSDLGSSCANLPVGSMGQVAMESFFALLQKNVLDRRRWITRTEFRVEIIAWIERTYHGHRRQARLTSIEC